MNALPEPAVTLEVMFAVPGDLGTPTGGYAYARRLMHEAPPQGLALRLLPLPDTFPFPDRESVVRARALLGDVPPDCPILCDGLAYGALPETVLGALSAPLVALCHHPLALETGLSAADAALLHETERAALARAAAVVTTSDATAGILSDSFGVAPERITVARPGTDPCRRSEQGAGACRILSVGSLTPRKGHDGLVTALAEIADLPWSCQIVGPERDLDTGAALRRQIAEAGLEGRVTLAGSLSDEALAEAYAEADLFALASRFEGFGMVFREAMARGLPVVGLRSPAVEEATCGAGVLVDPDALGAALRRLVGERATRAGYAAKAWDAAQQFTRWSETAVLVRKAIVGAVS